MVAILMRLANLAILGFLTIEVLRNKGYDAIISVHNVTKKSLLRDSNYIVDVVIWPKLANSSISMREVIPFLGLILTFVEAAGVKLVGGFLVSTILNRVQEPHLNPENLKFNLIDGCLALFLYDFWSSEKQTLNSFFLKDRG